MTLDLSTPSMDMTAIIVSIVAVLGSLLTIVISLRREKNDIDKKNVDSLMTRVGIVEAEKKDLEHRVSECEAKHTKNLEERGKLQGTVATLERVLENRDPKMQDVLSGILKFMERIETHLSKGTTVNVNPVPTATQA